MEEEKEQHVYDYLCIFLDFYVTAVEKAIERTREEKLLIRYATKVCLEFFSRYFLSNFQHCS